MALTLDIDTDSSIPMYVRIAEALIGAIENERLQPGDALPSTRALAASLSLAPLTVHRAYQELLSRGYAETVAGLGTFVRYRQKNDTSAPAILSSSAREPLIRGHYGQTDADTLAYIKQTDWSQFGRSLLANEGVLPSKPDLFAILYQSIPTKEQLPLATWRRILVDNSRLIESICMDYNGDAFGSMRLRKAIASYLRRARGANCDWEQVALFTGTQPALDIVCRLLLNAGDPIAMEEPGYFIARRMFFAHGARIMPISIDEEGISVQQLEKLPQPPKLVYITPSHQDPLGYVLSQRRRQSLVAWAERVNAFIVEDDNDCEFRLTAPRLPCVQSFDINERVIYLNTFWRSLGPLVRLGYAVVPRRLLNVYNFVKSITDRDLPLLEQHALADLIEEGHLERTIHKNTRTYKKRLQALMRAAATHLGGVMSLGKESAGMRILAHFDPSRFSNERIMEAACEAEFPLFDTKEFYLGKAPEGEFLVPFGQFDEQTISAAVERFSKAL